MWKVLRGLGKTPNDPFVKKMNSTQWRFCMLNIIEDEKEQDKKINDCLKFIARIWVGEPKGKDSKIEDNGGSTKGNNDLDVSYTTSDGGREISVRKVVSSEFDKIMNNPDEYKDPKLNLVKILEK